MNYLLLNSVFNFKGGDLAREIYQINHFIRTEQ